MFGSKKKSDNEDVAVIKTFFKEKEKKSVSVLDIAPSNDNQGFTIKIKAKDMDNLFFIFADESLCRPLSYTTTRDASYYQSLRRVSEKGKAGLYLGGFSEKLQTFFNKVNGRFDDVLLWLLDNIFKYTLKVQVSGENINTFSQNITNYNQQNNINNDNSTEIQEPNEVTNGDENIINTNTSIQNNNNPLNDNYSDNYFDNYFNNFINEENENNQISSENLNNENQNIINSTNDESYINNEINQNKLNSNHKSTSANILNDLNYSNDSAYKVAVVDFVKNMKDISGIELSINVIYGNDGSKYYCLVENNQGDVIKLCNKLASYYLDDSNVPTLPLGIFYSQENNAIIISKSITYTNNTNQTQSDSAATFLPDIVNHIKAQNIKQWTSYITVSEQWPQGITPTNVYFQGGSYILTFKNQNDCNNCKESLKNKLNTPSISQYDQYDLNSNSLSIPEKLSINNTSQMADTYETFLGAAIIRYNENFKNPSNNNSNNLYNYQNTNNNIINYDQNNNIQLNNNNNFN